MARRKSAEDAAVNAIMSVLLATPWQVSATLLAAGLISEIVWRNNSIDGIFGLIPIAAGMVALLKHAERALLLRQTAGIDDIRALSWRDFEELITQAYHKQGYSAERRGGSGPDGGVDVILRGHGEKVIVQCKCWNSTRAVSVTKVRELGGVIAENNADRAIFVTSSTYSPDALSYGANATNKMTLIDGPALVKLLAEARGGRLQAGASPQEIPPLSSRRLQDEQAQTSITPKCPTCGTPMVARMVRKGEHAGKQFWGCPQYPRCRGTRELNFEAQTSEQSISVS